MIYVVPTDSPIEIREAKKVNLKGGTVIDGFPWPMPLLRNVLYTL